MILDVERDVVDGSDLLVAFTELFGDMVQPYTCHAGTIRHRQGQPSRRGRTVGERITSPAMSDETTPATAEPTESTVLDLDAIERDLAGVEVALARLDAGTYWTDEVTGAALPDELLAQQPTARRAEL